MRYVCKIFSLYSHILRVESYLGQCRFPQTADLNSRQNSMIYTYINSFAKCELFINHITINDVFFLYFFIYFLLLLEDCPSK